MRPRRSYEEAEADTRRQSPCTPEEVVPTWERTDNRTFRDYL